MRRPSAPSSSTRAPAGKGGELDRDQADSAGRWEAKVDNLNPGAVVSAKVTPGFSIGFNCLSATSPSKRVAGKK